MKSLARITIKTLAKYQLLFSFLLIGWNTLCQVEQVRYLDSVEFASKMDSLREACSYHKTLIPQFETEILSALSYYPELDSTKIIFKKAKIKASLNARPTVGSLFFRRKSKRTYIIRIKPNEGDSIATLEEVGFNGAVGVLGHELNHVVDYSNRGFFGIIGRLFNYGSKKGKQKFEGEIDRMTVEKGLGWQLYDWEDYVLNKSNAKEKYKAYKKAIYYTPEEIITLINRAKEQN